MINYIRFLHRVINFITPPCVAEVAGLSNALTSHWFAEMDTYSEYERNTAVCMLDRWEHFLASQKGAVFKSKLKKYKRKYAIFHTCSEGLPREMTEELIKEGIRQIVNKVGATQEGNEKHIIGADYLTTFYQLWHMKKKHTLKDFFTMSKIDLIMEGNPYNVNKNHLTQLKRKLVLIDVIS
jgi:hypothetical protein